MQRTTLYSHLLIRWTHFVFPQVRKPVDEIRVLYVEGKPKIDSKLIRACIKEPCAADRMTLLCAVWHAAAEVPYESKITHSGFIL